MGLTMCQEKWMWEMKYIALDIEVWRVLGEMALGNEVWLTHCLKWL